MRILVVEDDSRIANFVAKGLREQTYAVDVSANGEDALYQASINAYDLAILDVMIPAPDGLEVCRRLRQTGLRFPILMLTARDATDDRVRGLDTGADDYLTKPFEFRELLARLRDHRFAVLDSAGNVLAENQALPAEEPIETTSRPEIPAVSQDEVELGPLKARKRKSPPKFCAV